MACGTLVRLGADLFALSGMGDSADWGAFVAPASGLSHLLNRVWLPGNLVRLNGNGSSSGLVG
jgi:hypothetical protein